jgi:peptide methionine sulfoxide reductase msrA/msrB
MKTKQQKATFAGGCFWCIESEFKEISGVLEAVSGYTGGHTDNPTYEQVCSGTSGHIEAVEVKFDNSVITYAELVDAFWRQIDPTDRDGQFADRGSQYQPVIFYHDTTQKEIAENSRAKLEASGRFPNPIATDILPATKFYPAEEYHQDYYLKHPVRYKMYRHGSGRDSFLKKSWDN